MEQKVQVYIYIQTREIGDMHIKCIWFVWFVVPIKYSCPISNTTGFTTNSLLSTRFSNHTSSCTFNLVKAASKWLSEFTTDPTVLFMGDATDSVFQLAWYFCCWRWRHRESDSVRAKHWHKLIFCSKNNRTNTSDTSHLLWIRL